MFETSSTLGWAGSLAWLGGIAAASFLVSWVFTDRLGVGRTLYVGVLAALTAGLTAGYLLWSDAGTGFWNHAWPWGLVAAAVTGAVLAMGVRRMPSARTPERPPGPGAYLWESVVYGTTEGLLLSVLPVVVTWQALAGAGWTEGWRAVPAGIAAMAASALVIGVHHLGYRGYRSRRMIFPVAGCLVLSLGYLLTGSPIAAVGGHIVLHLAMQRRGVELPPHEAPQPGPTALRERRLAAV